MSANTHPLGHKQKIAPAQVLQKAQEVGVALSLVNGRLNAAGEREAVQVLAPLLRQYRDDLIRLLTEAANDPANHLPELAQGTAPKAAASDPGHDRLLALAMAFCDHISASAQAREDWRRDVADTPPHLRQGLAAYLREQMRHDHTRKFGEMP